jgi:hypothetical protein
MAADRSQSREPRVAVNAELGIPLEAYMKTPYTPFIQKP